MPHPTSTDPQTDPQTGQPTAVDIYDGTYHLRGSDPAYLHHLASLVDAKMRAVAATGATVDSLRVAVLAALNLADELATLRARHEAATQHLRQTQREVRSRTGSLTGLLDQVLEDEHVSMIRDTRRAG